MTAPEPLFLPLLTARPAPPAAWRWPRLPQAALALGLVEHAARCTAPILTLAADARMADRLSAALHFFAGDDLPIVTLPEREMLPYDIVSPPRALASERLRALTRIPRLGAGIVIVTADAALERLPPQDWLAGASFDYGIGQRLDIEPFQRTLIAAGYVAVTEVRAPGEFAVRGGLIDVYPAGAESPLRIDLFDNEIDTLRQFDPQTQLSGPTQERFSLLPAFEFPFDEDGIKRFRQVWRARFAGDPMATEIYRAVSRERMPPGIENWLPLFHESTANLADYLPAGTTCMTLPEFDAALDASWHEIETRYENARHDIARPLLEPDEAFTPTTAIRERLATLPQIELGGAPCTAIAELPELGMEPDAATPLRRFQAFVADYASVLFSAESPGRRESVRERLARETTLPELTESWADYRAAMPPLALAVAELEEGFAMPGAGLAAIPDAAVFGARAATRRRQRQRSRDPATIIRDLTDLAEGAPVVHQDHGVGRFHGLMTQEVDGQVVEFVLLEYANNDRLYIPVSSLERLSRYIGSDAEHAPLTHLGSGQWDKARRRAAAKARDAAAELLELYARRETRPAQVLTYDRDEWERFTAAFPFDETPDQARAIDEVIADLTSDRPMDRLVCGDVGFGKTEVALRAAFVAVQTGHQVVLLAPTTLLADQHYRNFLDRFADWPVRIELLSRFRGAKQQSAIREALSEGRIDIIVGTHALLGRDVRLKSLGLIIVDEEQRFGVRHKERLRALRAEVDMLTLTATPIPRTLSMTLAGIRDLSLIATAPEERLPIRTVVSQWQDAQIRDALMRELRRGGQVFVVHNEVRSIAELAERIHQLVPEANVRIGHGQMSERELETLMVDFYHRRFDILVSTTIIESGIDIATANTILINNAHRFGLSQLHQLRGRVGRSHHQAYAYLITPPEEYLGRDAKARLDAIASMEELGAGFFLATQDLEIRGAGALLGEQQSGQMQEIGLELYNRLLARAVKTLKAGGDVEAETDFDAGCEIELGDSALLPADYVPDVHMRLVLYKRIASSPDEDTLEDLAAELVDRFGVLPDAAQRLFDATRIKQRARRLGIRAIHADTGGARIDFNPAPTIDTTALIKQVQTDPKHYRLQGEKRLSIRHELPDFAERYELISRVLTNLTPATTKDRTPSTGTGRISG
ncbi:MAG: transcription-repair coupling factor [Gammaproteobacteria bacterium]